MKMSLPQLIMLGHAAHCNYERIKSDDDKPKSGKRGRDGNGEFLDTMSPAEKDAYYAQW